MEDRASTTPSGYNRAAYQQYPYLTQEEFAETCHLLDSRYCRATLGPLRKQWRLNVHTALNMSSVADSDFVTFLQITRSLDENPADVELALRMDTFCLDGRAQKDTDTEDDLIEADTIMMEMEDSDRVGPAQTAPINREI